MATTNAPPDGGFRRWRRSRPFWGGLLLLIAGLELFLSANLTLGDLEVHMGPEGFLSYLLPLLLVLSGVLSWVTPAQRLFYGVLGLLTAVYSLVGLNLGGFGLGMLIGIFGGALVLAWSPTRSVPAAPAPAGSSEDPPATDHPGAEPASADQQRQDADHHSHDPAATMIVPGFHDDSDDRENHTAPLRPAHRPDPAQQFPTAPAYPSAEPPVGGEPPQPPSGGIHRKTLVITLIPLAMTAALLVAGGQSPARADVECPEGLPSRPAAEAKREAAKQSSAKPSPSRAAAKKGPRAGAKPSLPAPVSPRGAEKTDLDENGNPIADGWNGFVDGVGDLLGVGDGEEAEKAEGAEPTPEPSTTTSAPATPVPPVTASPSGAAPTAPPPPGQPGDPAPHPERLRQFGLAVSLIEPVGRAVPGPRVFKKAESGGLPQVSLKSGLLETASLTMYDPVYDGVAELRTSSGTVRALKFSMTKAVNKPFRITVPEAGGRKAVKTSDELVAKGDVRFYTTKFEGKLFGVIPITFTPDEPPPLTLPILWFTDAKIELALVQSKTMTFDNLRQIDRA